MLDNKLAFENIKKSIDRQARDLTPREMKAVLGAVLIYCGQCIQNLEFSEGLQRIDEQAKAEE